MTFTKTRAWIAGAVVVGILLTVAAWFLLISPKRAEAAETRELTAAAASRNDQLRAEIAALKADFAQLPQYEAELAAIRLALPEDDKLNTVIRDLEAQAGAANVQLLSIAPGTPAAYADQEAPAEAPAADSDPATETGEPADATAAAAAPAASASLVRIPLQVVVNGNFTDTEVFLRHVQQNLSRDFLITGLTMAPLTGDAPGYTVKNGDVTVTLSGTIYAYAESAPATAEGTATDTASASGPDAAAQ